MTNNVDDGRTAASLKMYGSSKASDVTMSGSGYLKVKLYDKSILEDIYYEHEGEKATLNVSNSAIVTTSGNNKNNFKNIEVNVYDNGTIENSIFSGNTIITTLDSTQPENDGLGEKTIKNVILNDKTELRSSFGANDKSNSIVESIIANDESYIKAYGKDTYSNVALNDSATLWTTSEHDGEVNNVTVNNSAKVYADGNDDYSNVILNDSTEFYTNTTHFGKVENITANGSAYIAACGDDQYSNVTLNDKSMMQIAKNTVSMQNITIKDNGSMYLGYLGSEQVNDYTINGTFTADGGKVKWLRNGNDESHYNQKTLTIDKLVNNDPAKTTEFVLRTDLDGEKIVESVHIKDANAGCKIGVSVLDKSKVLSLRGGDNKKVLVVKDDSMNLEVVGKKIDNGGLWNLTPTIENGLQVGGTEDEWYLTNIQKENNDNTNTILDGFASDYSLWLTANDTLRKRLGDIRNGITQDDGVWVRTYHGKLKGEGYKNNYHIYQIGYDKTRGQYTEGFFLERSEGNLSFNAGSGENDYNALGLYSTWLGDKGHYTDIVLRAGRLGHEMNTYGEFADSSDYHNATYSISFEYGKQKNYDNGWFVTPQAQLTLGRIEGIDFTTANGTKVDVGGLTSAIGRIGVEAGRHLGDKGSYYVKLGAFHEFNGERNVSMLAANGDCLKESYDYSDTWYEIGVGAQVKTSDNTYFYCDAERSLGGSDTEKVWQFNAGFRWDF